MTTVVDTVDACAVLGSSAGGDGTGVVVRVGICVVVRVVVCPVVAVVEVVVPPGAGLVNVVV